MKILTPKQAAFIKEYLIDLNATQAAIRAGYSEKGATVQGARLLANAKVQKAIQEEMKAREARTEVTIDRVVKEISRLALADPRKIFDEHDRILPIHKWPDDVAAMVAGIDVVTKSVGTGEAQEIEYIQKLKFWDKNSALDKLMKHLAGYAAEKHELSGPGGGSLKIVVKPPEFHEQ